MTRSRSYCRTMEPRTSSPRLSRTLVTSATFSTSYTSDLASVLGASTAWVGFTGGTGAGSSTQTVSNFTFRSHPQAYERDTVGELRVSMMAAYGCWARQVAQACCVTCRQAGQFVFID